MNKGRLKLVIAGAIGVSMLTGGAVYAFHGQGSPTSEDVQISSNAPTIEEHDLGSTDNILPQDVANKSEKQEIKHDNKKEDKKDNTTKEENKDKQVKQDKKNNSKDTTDSSSKKTSNIKSTEKKEEHKSSPSKTKTEGKKQSPSTHHSKPSQTDWVAKLNVAKQCSQLVTVQASGKTARVQFHKKGSNGIWKQEFSTDGFVGYNGITSNKREGDGKTPVGVYSFGTAFGIAGNPGTSLGYRHITNNDYWVDDVHSSHYNEWVNTSHTKKDWKSAEHMISQPVAYRYGIVINYNTGRTPGKGSGIFLHCSKGGGTAGCVAIPQSRLVQLMKEISPNARIVISSYNGIYNY